jgi:plastocyanin
MKRVVLLTLLAFGLTAAAPAVAGDVAVVVGPNGFPPQVSIQNGDSVTWKNGDSVNRQIVADDGTWKSPVLTPGQSWSHVFVRGGTFSYHGAFKPAQHGTVQVAAVRATLMRTNFQTVPITGTVRIKGQISELGATGEHVTIQAQPRGSSTWSNVAEVATKNQFFVATVKPRRNTLYRAVWNNVPSNAHRVNVTPLVGIKQVGRSRIQVGVRADAKLVGHRVLLQRFNKRTHAWHSFTSLKLTHVKATMSLYNSLGAMRLTLPHGTIVRAYVTRAQAGPYMYGPAFSRGRRL